MINFLSIPDKTLFWFFLSKKISRRKFIPIALGVAIALGAGATIALGAIYRKPTKWIGYE